MCIGWQLSVVEKKYLSHFAGFGCGGCDLVHFVMWKGYVKKSVVVYGRIDEVWFDAMVVAGRMWRSEGFDLEFD